MKEFKRRAVSVKCQVSKVRVRPRATGNERFGDFAKLT